MHSGNIVIGTSMHTINISDASFTFYSKSHLLYFQVTVTVLLSFHTARPVFAKGLEDYLLMSLI